MTEKQPIRGIVLDRDVTCLIVKATEEDVATFARDDAVTFAKHRAPTIGQGMTLFDAHGNPVALITDINVEYDRLDVATFGDDADWVLVPGIAGFKIQARGIGDPALLLAGWK